MILARSTALAAVVFAALLTRCTSGPTAAGGSTTETTNGFAATIAYPSGKPAAHAVVRTRRTDYLADSNSASAKSLASRFDVLTDDSGRFAIDGIDTGDFLIEAADANGNALVITCSSVRDSVVDLGMHALAPMGTIAGSLGGPSVRGLARVRGLERCVRSDSTGSFRVPVPADFVYQLHLSTTDTSVEITTNQPVQASTELSLAADLGTFSSDSVAVRAMLDDIGLIAVDVYSVILSDSASGRIRGLDLSDRGLPAIPASIGRLTFLWTLGLNRNPITALPSTLDQLSQLVALNLDSTDLASLPAVVTRCVRLEWLFIDGTGIRDLPQEIAGLVNLHTLAMNDDSLTEVPTAVFQLRHLKSLGLSRNALTTVPAGLGNLDSLQYLHLDDNRLTALPPEIGMLDSLKALYAYGNVISWLPPEIGNCATLAILTISNNALDSLPSTIGSLTRLDDVNLYENRLASLPDAIVALHPSSLTIGANRLCTVSPAIAAWADTYAEPGWSSDQTCP